MPTQIELFFEDPNTNLDVAGESAGAGTRRYGNLFHLRRTIIKCVNQEIYISVGTHLMQGIELIGLFLAGTDEQLNRKDRRMRRIAHADDWRYGSGSRFKKVVSELFPAKDQASAEHLYRFRCSLIHSFGFQPMTNLKFMASYSPVEHVLVIPNGANSYIVNLSELRLSFEAAVENYRLRILAGGADRTNFDLMYPQYGSMTVSQPGYFTTICATVSGA